MGFAIKDLIDLDESDKSNDGDTKAKFPEKIGSGQKRKERCSDEISDSKEESDVASNPEDSKSMKQEPQAPETRESRQGKRKCWRPWRISPRSEEQNKSVPEDSNPQLGTTASDDDGKITGNQPRGSMTCYTKSTMSLPGFEGDGCIMIHYNMPSAIQTYEHPNPGLPCYGTYRVAYLPNNTEGQKVLRLLQLAFERGLVFKIGRSETTGQDNVVTWNGIHHKTNVDGGPRECGYPDDTYLKRVQQELAAMGVTEEKM